MQEALDILNSQETLDEEDYLLKSLCLSGLGKYEDALTILENALGSSKTISLWHKTGQLAMQLGKLSQAIEYFSKVIYLSEIQNSDYFLADTYLQRSNCYYENRDFEKALHDLNFVDDSTNISWLRGVEPLSKKILLDKILPAENK